MAKGATRMIMAARTGNQAVNGGGIDVSVCVCVCVCVLARGEKRGHG